VNQFFSAEGENQCTSEKVRGQFSIFGAVEENHRCRVSRIQRIEELGEDIWPRRVEGGPSIEGEVRREESERVGGPIVHRDCTGNAERQGGTGAQFLVLVSRFGGEPCKQTRIPAEVHSMAPP
jgi:hypothetical protein